MAGRKDKNTVDYFPHYCLSGKTIFILENKFGNDGYAVWFKILELLGSSENHYIDCRDSANWEYLQAKMRVCSDRLSEILDTLSNLCAIDSAMWGEKIIWSENFIKNIEDAYIRRKTTCMSLDDLCEHLSIKCLHKYDSDGINEYKSTQSKGKEIKGKRKHYIYSEFYDSEIEKSNNNSDYVKFVRFLYGGNDTDKQLSRVLSLRDQLTYSQFEKILTKAIEKNKKLKDMLLDLENVKKYTTGKVSMYSTLNSWLNR